MSKRLTTEQFIEKARKVHGNRYDYSKVNYIDAYTPVDILCKKHGEFRQKPCSHLFGRGCKVCGYETVSIKNSINKEEFIQKAMEVHGNKYSYDAIDYVSATKKIKILCNRCNQYFYQSPTRHLQGQGCTHCIKKINGIKSRKSTTDFIREARSVHGDRYNYSVVQYITSHTPVEIICTKHGPFWQKPIKHIQSRQGCPKCRLSVGGQKFIPC